MSPIRLAVISDLHVGKSARSVDLNPFAQPSEQTDGFLSDFAQFVSGNGLSAHALLVPGDISDRGHPNEFQRAAEVIGQVANCLSVPHGRVFLVPGNHDLTWPLITALDGDTTNLGHALRFEPAKRQQWIYSRLRTSGNDSLFDEPYISIDETDRLVVIRYNSAENDLPSNKPHHGRITPDHLEALRQRLEATDLGSHRFKVFVVHHHPIIYSDPPPDLPEFSALQNAENLLTLLSKNQIDIVVHGHKHVPKFRNVIEEGRYPIAILGAGSFSRELDTAWAGLITNQFHLITLEERNTSTMGACGSVASWAYRRGGWLPSELTWSGMRHRRPFGAFVSESQFRDILYSRLRPKLLATRRLDWSDIESAEPYARYLDNEMLERVLRAFGADLNCVMQFDPSQPEELLMVTT